MNPFHVTTTLTIAVAGALLLTPHIASSADEVTSLKAKPTVKIKNVTYEVEGITADPRQQMEALIGDVQSLNERVVAIDGAIDRIEARVEDLEALRDDPKAAKEEIDRLISVNEFMLSLLQSEQQNAVEEMAIAQAVDNGICPKGSTKSASTSFGSLTCVTASAGVAGSAALLSSTPSGLETLVYSTMAVVPASGRTTITMTCPAGYVVAGAGHYLPAAQLLLEQSRPDITDSQNWFLRFANWDTYTRYGTGYVNCVKIAQ